MVTYPNHYDADLFKLAVMSLSRYCSIPGFIQKTHITRIELDDFMDQGWELSTESQSKILHGFGVVTYDAFYKKGDETLKFMQQEQLYKAFGEKIIALRNTKKLKQFELASQLGVDLKMLHRVEKGAEYSPEIAQKLVRHFEDETLGLLFQKIQDSEGSHQTRVIKNNGILDVVEGIRHAPLIGSAAAIQEKPIKNLLATCFIQRFGKVSPQLQTIDKSS